MGKKDRVFLVFMIIIFLNVQLRTNRKPFYLSTTPGYVKGKFAFHFPNSGNARKRLPEFPTEKLIIKRSDIQLLVKLNYLTRKIKLKKVIRRFENHYQLWHFKVLILDNDVRNIETPNNIPQFNFILLKNNERTDKSSKRYFCSIIHWQWFKTDNFKTWDLRWSRVNIWLNLRHLLMCSSKSQELEEKHVIIRDSELHRGLS